MAGKSCNGEFFCLIRSYRQRFNAAWSPQKYSRFLDLIGQCCGEAPPFRHSETPCFFPRKFVNRIAQYGREMVEQLLCNPRYQEDSKTAIPPAFRAPGEDPVPLFVQADFGIDENFEPKLVEIQGFPSLYAYQPFLARTYREAFQIEKQLSSLPEDLNEDQYHKLMRETIVAGHDPETVILMEIDPMAQKTRCDFLLTEKLYGVRAVDIRAIQKQAGRLFYKRNGELTPIHRIYNRTIADELMRREIALPFDFRDDLQVEWAGHPNWFFRLSKFSLPYIHHPALPATRFLDEVDDLRDSARYVLKPLYSFAGLGIVVSPTPEQLGAIPAERRRDYILQERIDFKPAIETPHGPTKFELRIMYVWQGGLQFVNTIVRMGRGVQMGVDHNKGAEWVGASAAFLVGDDRE
jgi:hypothetical protein